MTTYFTGNPIGSVDVKDLYDNAQNLDIAMQTTEKTWVDRLGVTRRSWAGSTGYDLLGDYAAGIEVTSFNQTIRGPDGEFWRAAAGTTLPYVTTGAGLPEDGAFVPIGDAALRQELSDPLTGASNIGVQRPFPGSIARTQGDINSQLPITPQDFGAVGDGIADDTAAMLAFASSGFHMKYIPTGSYKVTQEIIFNPGDYIYGDGQTSVIDADNAEFSGARVMSASGDLVPLPALSQSVARRTNTLVFSSAPDLALGDVILIWNPTDSSWSTWRPDYRAGEWCRVATIDGNTVTVFGLTYDGYSPGDVQLYKLVGDSISAKNFRIKQPLTNNAGLSFFNIDSPVIEDVTTGGAQYAGLALTRCVDIRVSSKGVQASSASGNNYGLVIANCQGGSIEGEYYGTRHSVSLGGTTGIGSVTTRGLRIYSNMRNLGNEGGIASQDLHGNTEDIQFIGGTFTGGGICAGRNNTWVGCKFQGKYGVGLALQGGELVGGVHRFVGCSFASDTNPNPSANGIIGFPSISEHVFGDSSIIFTDSAISCPVDTLYPISFSLNGYSGRLNIIFDGINFTSAAGITAICRIRDYAPAAGGNFGLISLKNITGLPTTGGAYMSIVTPVAVTRYQLPEQRGSVSVTSTIGQTAATGAVSYTWSYPVNPSVIVGNASVNFGGRRGVAGHGVLSNTGFSAILASGDLSAFTSVENQSVDWSAVIL